MLQRAFFATFGMSGSRHLLLVEPGSRPIQLRGYGGPVIYGQTRKNWIQRHGYGAFFVSWKSGCIRDGKAGAQISDYEGEMASGLQGIVLRKTGSEWFAVKWIEGPIS
jgi:hypothetical protein